MSNNILTEAGRHDWLFMHPAIVVLIIASFILIISINIKYSTALMLFLSIIIPMGQGFKIIDLNFNIFRVLLLAGWIKIIIGNFKLEKHEKTDKIIIYWVVISFVAYIIPRYNIDSVINRLGFAYNAIGTYFLYRIIIRENEDFNNIYNTLAIVTAFVAVFMIIEQATAKNLFYVFGGVEEFTPVRHGRLRSQGPFAHPITAGIFGATLFPVYFSMWRHKWGNSVVGLLGTLSAGLVVITSSSTGPVIAFASGLVALMLWPLRNHMDKLRYAVLFSLVFLHIIMKAPVWALIARSSLIAGSTSWHRYYLVDNLINRLKEWFFFGVTSTAHWGYGMGDLSNQYYFEAVNGGFFKLAFFIIIIVINFSIIGKRVKILTDISSQKKFWALGSALFANIVGFIGIAYWDQMLYTWYLFLASITSICLINSGKHQKIDDILTHQT